jgi:hypothetical protein
MMLRPEHFFPSSYGQPGMAPRRLAHEERDSVFDPDYFNGVTADD